MIFQRFLKRRATPNRAVDPASLSRVARESDDVSARREATRRLDRLTDLRAIAGGDPDAGVRDIAEARLRHLLCGNDDPCLPLEERLHALAGTEDERLLGQVATSGAEPELRRAAIDRLNDARVLTACAAQDPVAANRHAAVDRIGDRASLEQLVRQIGKKDKRAYRLAKARIKAIAKDETEPQRLRQQIEALCERLERLGRFGQWEQDHALLALIERDWTALANAAEPAQRTRFEQARTGFLNAYEAQRREQDAQVGRAQAQQDRRRLLHGLLDELARVAELNEASEVAALAARARAAWQTGPALPDAEQAELDERFDRALTGAAEHQRELAAQHRDSGRLDPLRQAIDERLAQSQPLDLAQTRSLIAEARGLAANTTLDSSRTTRLSEQTDALALRLEKQRRHAEQRIAQLETKLETLAESLAEGELKRAEPLLQSLQAGVDLAKASGLPRQAYAEIAAHIQRATPRIKELQGWRRWGTNQQRENLCQAMDALRERDTPPENLIGELRELQQAWKALDQGGAPADRRRWERFHAAAEDVYERCRPYLEAQATEREANRRAREQICADLEDFLHKVDWERVDWKKAVRAAREMRQSWGHCGPTEGRHRKALEQRFRTALKTLDAHLDAERRRNRELREGLIGEVEAMAGAADLDLAIETTKACQRRWHTTVAGRKADENALWQRFRAACDAVFDRRRSQIEARESERQENLQGRTLICTEAEALAQGAETEPQDIEAALQALERRWQETASLPLPRHEGNALAQRWQRARQGVTQRLQQARTAERRRTLGLLAQQAELCTRMEWAAADTDDDNPDRTAIQTAWAELPAHADASLQAAIGARFATALERGEPASAETLAANHREREALCLQLEILAQVESPPELASERLAVQVNRLSERMEGGVDDPLANAAGLLTNWFLCGPAPPAPELEERFARVRAALGN